MTAIQTDRQFDDILHSKRDIMQRMRIGEERFLQWLELGAPIACEVAGGRVLYSADIRCLQAWRVATFPWRKAQTKIER